jgi:hypothetical protein
MSRGGRRSSGAWRRVRWRPDDPESRRARLAARRSIVIDPRDDPRDGGAADDGILLIGSWPSASAG